MRANHDLSTMVDCRSIWQKTKTSVVLRCGLQVDLRVVAHASYGSALLYFTTLAWPRPGGGWLEAADVLNTRSLKQLRKCLQGR